MERRRGTRLGGDRTEYETNCVLANHLIRSLVSDEFDIAHCNKLRSEIGVGHAFGFLYRCILPGGKLPMVPVMASGGLSHVVIDEEIDQMTIDGLKNN